NLDAWTIFNLRDATTGSHGSWLAQSGGQSPLSSTQVVAAPNGTYQAMLDQETLDPVGPLDFFNNNGDDTVAGSHALYQDITIPAGATSAKLSLRLTLDSAGPWSDAVANPSLDYRG